jgi:hypothetical protein
VAERKAFLLRLDSVTMAALRAWSADDLRSLNGQVEFLLRRALRDAGRLPPAAAGTIPHEAGGAGAHSATAQAEEPVLSAVGEDA